MTAKTAQFTSQEAAYSARTDELLRLVARKLVHFLSVLPEDELRRLICSYYLKPSLTDNLDRLAAYVYLKLGQGLRRKYMRMKLTLTPEEKVWIKSGKFKDRFSSLFRHEVAKVGGLNALCGVPTNDPTLKARGITISAAAREYGISWELLWRWAEDGLIPTLRKGKGAGSPTYLDKEVAKEVAAVCQEAKEIGIQPIKLLRYKQRKGWINLESGNA